MECAATPVADLLMWKASIILGTAHVRSGSSCQQHACATPTWASCNR